MILMHGPAYKGPVHLDIGKVPMKKMGGLNASRNRDP
jgi:hypothetical protein